MRKQHQSVIRFLLDGFAADPEIAWTTADIAMQVYGVTFFSITKSHRVATIRAMKTVNQRIPRLSLMRTYGPHGWMVIFNSHNVKSYCMARLKTDDSYDYQRPNSWGRGEWDENKLFAHGLDHHLCGPVMRNTWPKDVQRYIAKDTGDRKTYLTLEIEKSQGALGFMRGILAMTGTGKGTDELKRRTEYIMGLQAELLELEAAA